MKVNLDKTVSAQQDGMIISYRESNKYQFLAYQDKPSDLSRPRYQAITEPVFNKVQQKLYAQTVYGLGHYSPKHVSSMSPAVRARIEKKHMEVQETLNCWKQEIVYSKVDKILSALFPKSKLIKTFCSYKKPEKTITSHQSFKELGLDQVKIANKLIEKGFLPTNFFSLGIKQ